jgi:hypothetical protein
MGRASEALWAVVRLGATRAVARTTRQEEAHENERRVLDRVLALARTQLLVQVADEGSLDVRTAGMAGFNVALVALTTAAKNLLGPDWRVPIPFLIISTFVLLFSIFGRLERRIALVRGRQRRASFALGPSAAAFYEEYGEEDAQRAGELLLGDLAEAYRENAQRYRAKHRRLQAAIFVLFVGFLVSTPLIATHLPTNMETCPKSAKQCAHPGSQSSDRAKKPRSGTTR